MKTPFRFSAALTAIVAQSAFAAPSQTATSCTDYYSTLEQRMKAIARHFDPKERGGLGKLASNIRDSIRRQLQYRQGHEYPIISMNDGTPIEAKVLAKSAFGETVPKPADAPPITLNGVRGPSIPGGEMPGSEFPIPGGGLHDMPPSSVGNYTADDIADIKGSVEQTLLRVENYEAEIKQFIDETASMAAEKEALENYLRQERRRRSDIRVDKVPSIQFGADGKPEITAGSRYFESEVRLRLRIKELGQELKKRIGRDLSTTTEANNRALAQAVMTKRLESFRGELMTQQSIHGDRPIGDAETQALLDRINALYETDARGVSKLKKEYRPPHWAWDKLKWAQLKGEFASFWLKYYPTAADEVKRSKIVEFAKNLSPEEKRALGVDQISNAASLMKRARYWRVVPAASASLTGLASGSYYYAIKPVYDLVITDSRKKEECAGQPTEDQFVNCLHEFLEAKFPKTYRLASIEKKRILDPAGKIDDPKIVAEIDDTVKRRNELMHKENIVRELRDATGAVVRDKSKGDASVRQRIVEADSDEEFTHGILGSGPEDKASYFAFQYPQNFASLRGKIAEILNTSGDEIEARQKKLAELRRFSPTIAAELEQMLVDRDFFKQGFGFHNPGFPGGAGPIITTPGPIFNPGPMVPGTLGGGTTPLPGRRINNRPFNPATDPYYVIPPFALPVETKDKR